MDILQKGTDTNALGSCWLIINIDASDLPEGESVTKVDIVCGDLLISVEHPTFPLELNLTAEQTRILKDGRNVLHLYGYDSTADRFKFDGYYEFIAKQEG